MSHLNPFFDNLFCCFIKCFAVFIRKIPVSRALAIGRFIGYCFYYFDVKHKTIAYGNLKIAFAKTKTPNELKKITKQMFLNYGQSLMELFRLPLMTPEKYKEYIKVDGLEHLQSCMQKGKGLILMAMHFGSWEMASNSCGNYGYQYNVIVKPQKRFSKLDELLHTYRTHGGNMVLNRGMGTREMIRSLKNNEMIGLVVDQGGRDGVLVPFFGREASMSVGAIRLGLKLGVPLSFSIIIREKGPQHRMIFHPPLELDKTGDVEQDVLTNLKKVTSLMEDYIQKYPAEYMWYYKIWKYSKESTIVILSDGKAGHLHQSKAITERIEAALAERKVRTQVRVIPVEFKSKFAARILSLLSFLVNAYIYQGRLEILKWFLKKETFDEIMSSKADFVISCGSSMAAVNYLVARDQQAKSISVLKPSILNYSRFDMVVLPQHDISWNHRLPENILVVKGSPNLITEDYLKEQRDALLHRYSHLKSSHRMKIGLVIGGDNKDYILNEVQMRVVINQVRQVSEEIGADLLVTTSRRTSTKVENLLQRELKRCPQCELLILANRNNASEVMGGILGLADILLVSGDSISMISEASSSGKPTVVFMPQKRAKILRKYLKHDRFVDQLHKEGYIACADTNHIARTIYNITKNKISTKKLSNTEHILEAVRHVI